MTKAKPREKILEIVKKLHNKAESSKTLGESKEAEAFAARVARMMTEHKISMDELEMTELQKLEPIERGEGMQPAGRKSKRVAWVENLTSVIADAYYCRILVVQGTSTIILVGRKSDREIAEWMINWMVPWLWQLSYKEMMAARKRVKKEGEPLGARGFRSSFLNGFILGLADRFYREREEQVKAAQERGTSHALVRVDSAREAVREWINQNVKGSVKSVSMSVKNRMGREAGQKAAREVNLNRPIEGNKMAGYLG